MSACLFCKILAKEIPAKIVYDDESCVAFQDINPQAPVHLLVIPKKHFASTQEASATDELLIGHLHLVAAQLARQHNIAEGYRVVVNTGADAGQTVFHLHLHVLGGRSFHWPPG
jgi:histidine triad (HIT) family protein